MGCPQPDPVQAVWLVNYLEFCFIVFYVVQALMTLSFAMCITDHVSAMTLKLALSPAAFRGTSQNRHTPKVGCDSVDVLCLLDIFNSYPFGVKVWGMLITKKQLGTVLVLGAANCLV